MSNEGFYESSSSSGSKENADDFFSFDSTKILSSRKPNPLPISPVNSDLKTPVVALDRKASSSLIKGIFSCLFFLVFPLAISAVIGGFCSLKAPNYRKRAKVAIVLGIISLVFFFAAVCLFCLFYDEIYENYISRIFDFFMSLPFMFNIG